MVREFDSIPYNIGIFYVEFSWLSKESQSCIYMVNWDIIALDGYNNYKQVCADRDKQVCADKDKLVCADKDKQVCADKDKLVCADRNKQVCTDRDKQVCADRNKQVCTDRDKQVCADKDKQVKRTSFPLLPRVHKYNGSTKSNPFWLVKGC